MRIVTVITRLIRGGAQRLALETAAHLVSRGHEAPIWTGPESGPEGSLLEEARQRGLIVEILPDMVRSVDPVRDLLAYHDLKRRFRRRPPDWVHTHSSKAGILGRFAARAAGVPRIAHTVHGWGFTPDSGRLARQLFIHLERRASPAGELLFVSTADREAGIRLGIIREGTGLVLSPGIDLTPYQDPEALRRAAIRTRREVGFDEGDEVVGFLGRLSPQKDPATALAAISDVARRRPAMKGLLVGDGPMARELRGLAASDAALRNRMVWAGLQREPHRWLAAMDILLLPSRWEGAPLTVKEALAAAVPVVASDLPGVSPLLDTPHGTCGVAVPPGDARGFAHAVEGLLADPERRRRMGNAGRRHALEAFGLEPMLAALCALYEGGASSGSA